MCGPEGTTVSGVSSEGESVYQPCPLASLSFLPLHILLLDSGKSWAQLKAILLVKIRRSLHLLSHLLIFAARDPDSADSSPLCLQLNPGSESATWIIGHGYCSIAG